MREWVHCRRAAGRKQRIFDFGETLPGNEDQTAPQFRKGALNRFPPDILYELTFRTEFAPINFFASLHHQPAFRRNIEWN
jgi:hypothetical protein